MLGLEVIKVRIAALLASVAVKKSTEEVTKNKTGSPSLHVAKALGINSDYALAYNGDVAVVVDNYESPMTHLPDGYVAAEIESDTDFWFSFNSLEPLAKLLGSKNLEMQMQDANVCLKNEESGQLQLLAFNHKQALAAGTDIVEVPPNISKIVSNLKKHKQESQAAFQVNVRDLSRICDLLKKVGDDFVEVKISNDGKMLIFTSKSVEEKEPHVECYLKITWGILY